MENLNEPDPLAALATSIRLHRDLAAQARADLITAMPELVAAIRHGSGQSAKVERILWSTWNGELCDLLAGLDGKLAQAVVVLIATRAHLGGDADDLLREIIGQSGTKAPTLTSDC